MLVTEPTVSGVHDLERIIEVCRHFKVPAIVCINKYDINEEKSRQIEGYCTGRGIAVIAKIPFDTSVNSAVAHGIPLVEYAADSPAGREIKQAWLKVRSHSVRKLIERRILCQFMTMPAPIAGTNSSKCKECLPRAG